MVRVRRKFKTFFISKNESKYPINKAFLPHARVLRLARRPSSGLSSTIPEDGVEPVSKYDERLAGGLRVNPVLWWVD